ncbi:hypothetical protein [Ciceribacter thiooxidans]|uniref:Uncharacterized protein n=1 Tax=Ciceribacter thiooxidans TaxID=1969821 RepID=A0ABV7HVJ9_9HYPH|nr:hypothetical protein [Ciceribacter thiooxidans]
MASVASMLSRVRRLEAARAAPLSPFAQAYGSLTAFEAEVQAEIDAGTLDSVDMPIILASIRKWDRERIWSAWRRDRVWEFGK